MPRKKVDSPATAQQVLDYFEVASDVEVKLVASLVEGKLRKRFAPSLTPTKVKATKGKTSKVAPATYGESLQDA